MLTLKPQSHGLMELDFLDEVNIIGLDLSSRHFLDRIKLSKISKKIGTLSSLTTLKLSRNRIKELPIEISQLQNLSYLDLSENQLKELPL